MDLPPFKPTEPELVPTGEHSWEVKWDRYAEADWLSQFNERTEAANRLLVIRNIDSANQAKITDAVTSMASRKTFSYHNVVGFNDFWQVLLTTFYLTYTRFPQSLGLSFIKHTRLKANSSRTIDGAVRRLADASTKIYTADTNAGVDQVLLEAGVKLRDDTNLKDTKILSVAGDGEIAFQKAISDDYIQDTEFKDFIDRHLFIIRGTYPLAEYSIRNVNIDDLRIVMLQETKMFPSGAELSPSGTPILSASVIDFEKAANLIEPIWRDKKPDPKSTAFVRLILEERARSVSVNANQLSLGELALSNVVNTIRQAVERSGDIHSIQPKQSPVDAEVVDEQLVLVERDGAATALPLESLEAFRQQYHTDATRLTASLIGTNAGGAFVARLEAACATLSREFTITSSLLLGDQARSLEVMLPSVSDVLTDVTAADVGAFVTGLGLLVRQFPAWRDFVNEARDTTPMSPSDEAALRQISEILENAADGLVAAELKSAVSKTASAREGLTDPVLDFALVRTIGNIFRAIGRYVFERANGIGPEFNKAFDKKVGEALAATAVSGLALLASTQLLHLAVGLPLEFGWLIGLGILLRDPK